MRSINKQCTFSGQINGLAAPLNYSLLSACSLPDSPLRSKLPPKQTPASGTTPVGKNPPESERKRLFGIIPNYRTFPSLVHYAPLTAGQKFKIAAQDSFDRGTFVLAAAFAGESQLANANPSFSDGAAAYGRYLGTAYADFVVGDMMTEAVYSALLLSKGLELFCESDPARH